MNTKFSRPDKPRGKFAQSNINLLYKGNASEIQSKPTIRSSGYQVVGKLQGTRRNPPPPPWVPSIKAEMGGQDTKVNIVPPGGSGWGTGPSTATNESSSSPSKNDSKEKQNEASSSILKDITENPPQNNAEDSKSSADDSETPLVKPPQKPFFELRSKTAVVGPPLDLSTDVVRPLSGKTLAPMVPFYQRPFASASNTMKDVDAVTDSSIEESKEESQSPTPASKSVSATARSSGWAAVASEEPDFQERIAFSDDDDDDVVTEDHVEEPARKLPAESSNEHPSPIKPLPSSASVSETPWVTPPPLTTSQVTFPRAAWDQPHSSFSSVSPMPPQSSFPVGSYCPLPRNDGLFPEDMLATTRGTDAALLSEQLQRASFTNTSEAQVQAQREERTLAYKSAVNRAQMARKKRCDEQQPVPLESTSKRNDRSMDSVKSGLTDVNIFPPSFMHPHGPSPYSTIPPAVNHSAQHSVEPVFAALYSGGLPNMLGNGFVPPPPQAMKPQAHLPNPLSASTWNPHGSFSASNNQPAAFMHPPYPLSNSPKLVPPPTNQGAYFKSDPFTAVYPQPPPPISKPEHPHHHPVDSVVHSFATPIGGETSANHLTGFQPPSKPLQQQQQSNSPILEKRLDSEAGGGKDLLNSLSTSLGSHALQISTHTNGTRTTAFTAPPVVDSSYPQTSTAAAAATALPRPQQPSTSHITPLMEVSLSGKWSEKDFEEVFENSSHGAYLKPFKSGRGGGNKHHDDQVRRLGGGFTPNTGRPPGGRGGAKRPIRPRPPNPEDEGEEIYECSRRQQYGAGEHDNAFPRSQQQQRSRGNNRGGVVARSNRDYEEDSRQNGADYERGEKCKGSGYKSNRHGGESGGVSEKANSIASAGSGFGRKNFSRSGPSNRRFDGNDDTSKSSTRNFSANQRKQQPESEDNAAGDYAASTQNDSEKLEANATQSDTEQPEGSTAHTYPSQRPHRGGSTGRGRRGAHSGSQRQAASQRRDHRINQNQPRINQQNNNNPRRHPDDDNDNHGTPSNSNNNAATSTTTVTTTSTEHSSTNKGESTGGGSSGSTPNESGGGQQQNHQQQSGTVDSLGTGSNKLRSHAHSVTLASDVGDVWETASEGFSSSLMGTSPGCSFADCATVRTCDNDDDNIVEHDDGYGKRPNTIQRGRRPLHSAPNVGKIIPLMSINAEAPPSFVNNPNFLDSPLPSPPPPVQKPSTKNEAKGGEKDAVESNTGEEQSAAGSSTDSSEDGFQEVKSKSARRQQQKAKLQQKTLKSSSSNDDRSSSGKSKSRDVAATTASTKKSRVQGTSKGTSEQQKFSKSSSATSKKSDEKDRQQQTRSANATTTTSPTKSSAENDVTKKALLIGPSRNPPPSAWLKPLQETINEKAAALAAARQQRNAKSASTTKAPQPMTSVASSGSVNSAVSVTSSPSSYAWSVVVGSRTTTTTSSENAVVSTPTSTSTTKVAVSKPIQNSGATTIPVSGESKPLSNRPNIAAASESQSKTATSTTAIGDKKGEDGLPVSATTTVAPSSTSAIVCKVLPQKQPESSAAAATSPVVTVAPSTRPESSTTFSTSNITNNNPVQTQPISNQPLSFRRPPFSDVGDWLGAGKANAPAALFLDSYNPGKKMDNTMSQEMNSIFMQHQHQQQSFRQQQQAMAPPQMMNFGLQELTLRNHQGSFRDSYFTPFSGGGNNGSQQRSIYTPQQKGGAAGWQPASWQPPPPQPPQAAHFEPSGLWSSNYSTPPPPPPASYVGVIGADRPSTNNSVATQQQQSRLQQQQQQSAAAAAAAHAVAFAAASIYGRGGGGGGSGSGQQPYPQPQPGGLYAQSPSQQQTPPPHLSFDPNFAYSNGGLAANSTSIFSHHQSSGGPALLAPHQQRQHQLVNSAGASVRDHPPPPMFINAVSHGTPYPPPAAAVLPTPGLHY